ncbi:hybrid sensor histidine kinase/response regulator [Aquabacterium sp. NJ1]|uniref:hybrid sensor histidine kinase/response regulator n=1 Tax=Aquabacterium sp. NJ1 TaxID=1538295 RepID=UPI0006911AEE|nr:hybrid sensor histidine kinase/response regulator [Aquabacterium sp. NJ1]
MTALDRLMPLWPHRSVRARFAWAIGLSGVLFAVLFSVWLAQDQRHQLQQAVSDAARREANVLGQIVSMALAERQRDIQQLASQPDVASGLVDAGAMRLALERIRASHPEFEWLALTNARGVVTTATGARLEGHDFSAQPWFVSGMLAPWLGKPQAAGPLARFLPRDVDGRPVQLIDMAVPVVDYEGRKVGVIVGMLNWRWIKDIHSAMVAQDDSLLHTLLLTPSGEVTLGPTPLLGKTVNPAGFEELRQGGSAQVIPWPDLGDQLTAVAPVRWFEREGKPPLLMVLRQDPDWVYGPANKLWHRMLFLGMLASALFVALSWWLAGRITRPLHQLAHAAATLREGEPSQFDLGPSQTDEIGALSQALHDMHTRLQARMNELATYRDHLEETVAQRTEQLQAARDKAEAATRAKSAFIANMSHEIRTPMNAIMGVNYLIQQGPLLPGQAERLRTVQEAAEHLLDIINNVLDLSKIEAGMFTLSPEDFDLPELLHKAMALVGDKAREKQLSLVVDEQGCPSRLHGDAMRLSQVLINLLSNAVKFTEQGQVTLKVRAEPRGEHEVQLHIEVQDTGVGISAEQAGKLFNAFVQADESTTRRFGGTGLGLAITRSLVELMGGRIGVRSQVGHGSVFWCLLPLGVAEAAPQAEATPDAPALSAEEAAALLRQEHGGARVLLAEDNAINSLLAMELLSMAGVDTTPAKNGAEAVALVQQQPFDLVLMDMHMPEMDGLQATRLIRQMPDQRDLPIVAMTASVLQEEKDACMAAGMNGHLSKPVDTQALYMALLKWFKMRRAGQALQGGAAAAAADTAAGPA